jgi:predicted nucleic acid-binding protein
MPPKLPVVINTGPLIALATALDDLEALAYVALRVVIPGEVFTELAAGVYHDDTANKARVTSCCDIRPMFSALPPSLVDSLDLGEAAVIHTALTEGIITVAIDELKGRRAARLHGLQVTGSLGMLVMLHQQGVVPSIEQAIQRIQDKGIFLSERIVQEAIAAVQPKG